MRARLTHSALATLLLVEGGCTFPFDRTATTAPGSVEGRAMRADVGEPAPFAFLELPGVFDARRTTSDGTFLVRGLQAGAWAVRLRDDDDGDGIPERTRATGFILVERAHPAGALDEGETRLASLLLGDVALDGPFAIDGRVLVERPGIGPAVVDPAAEVARAVVVRDVEAALAYEQLDARIALGAEAVAAADDEGRFRLAAVGSGAVALVGLVHARNGDGTLGAVIGVAPPVVVEGAAGDELDLDATPLVAMLDDVTAGATRDVEIALAPPPSGELRARVVATSGGEAIVDVTAPASATLSLDVPLGAWDLVVEETGGASGRLYAQVVVPGDGAALAWGPLLLSAAHPCGPAENDCDDDGLTGLPALEVQGDGSFAGELATWGACALSCGDAFGAGAGGAACETPSGAFDCDDDGDGQPDVTEHPRCYGPGLGTDLDADGLCDDGSDPYPRCAANDPADPTCAADYDAPFVAPPVLDEIAGGDVDGGVTEGDAGAPDAGSPSCERTFIPGSGDTICLVQGSGACSQYLMQCDVSDCVCFDASTEVGRFPSGGQCGAGAPSYWRDCPGFPP